MNKIILKGILKNIQYSHTTQDIEYYKANLLVTQENGKENLLNLKFKKFCNPYKENMEVSIIGNIRTYSQKLEDKNKVEMYVFTYFDPPEEEKINEVEIDGRICKINPMRKTQSGKDVVDFILANNVTTDNQSLNSYPSCVAWGKLAKIVNNLKVGDFVSILGQLQSREYKKKLNEEDYEIRIAHEISVSEINLLT